MGSATSTFEDWLESLETEAIGHNLIAALDLVSRRAARDMDARLWFVKIMGRRWSYLAGQVKDFPSGPSISRIRLSRDMGMVAEDWGKIGPGDRRRKLEQAVNRIIRGAGDSQTASATGKAQATR